MKNPIKLLLSVVVFTFNLSAQAQTKSPKLENSLLWEVSGNGLSKPSYLYGTIHMICSADYFLSEKAKKAFEASEKLVLEINLSDPNEIAEVQKSAMGKEPLSKSLNPEQLAKLDAILKKSTGMTIQQVDAFSLITVISLIAMKTFDCNDLKFYEMEFIESAKKRNLGIIGLETAKFQFKALENAFSNEEIINMLEASDAVETKELVAAYKLENLNTLYQNTTAEKVMNAKAQKIMLEERNINWTKILPEMMKKEPLFVAVGSGHLAGDFGIINLLRKAGYTIKPIMN
ncbi:TraB/GumN family protein [Flavobacterium hydrophilum]|uniref:TraB/GumN family protein n=1 Tax=Flavobacterium hydrophilum TaxID=2211445 RepID=A0A2V4C0Z7_9FLAO|nr:TraB/GumN family protein [Flavobacterium hydrophilum]PXY44542.1 TraB/GumN family protein [Flavobacterium hydrophilum]